MLVQIPLGTSFPRDFPDIIPAGLLAEPKQLSWVYCPLYGWVLQPWHLASRCCRCCLPEKRRCGVGWGGAHLPFRCVFERRRWGNGSTHSSPGITILCSSRGCIAPWIWMGDLRASHHPSSSSPSFSAPSQLQLPWEHRGLPRGFFFWGGVSRHSGLGLAPAASPLAGAATPLPVLAARRLAAARQDGSELARPTAMAPARPPPAPASPGGF